jgi:hypothetical protein
LRRLSREERLMHFYLRYNPGWWGTVLVTQLCMLLGHGFHCIVLQGGPVRNDETALERKVRIGWIYTYSGTFVFSALWDIGLVIQGIVESNVASFDFLAMGLAVEASYLLGDVHLLYRMRLQQTRMMHACVHGRLAFAAFLFGVFLVGLAVSGFKASNFPQTGVFITWCTRMAFSVFVLLSFIGYRPLLRLEYRRYRIHSERMEKLQAALVVLSQFVLLSVAFGLLGNNVWVALTGT